MARGFRVRHVGPAHSAEDLALYVEEDSVLFAGDLVFKERVPFIGEGGITSLVVRTRSAGSRLSRVSWCPATVRPAARRRMTWP